MINTNQLSSRYVENLLRSWGYDSVIIDHAAMAVELNGEVNEDPFIIDVRFYASGPLAGSDHMRQADHGIFTVWVQDGELYGEW